MEINLTNLGKRFNRDWILRNLDFQFENGKHYAITGPNGSGKSTLLQLISGSAVYNEGKIDYLLHGKHFSADRVFQKISFGSVRKDIVIAAKAARNRPYQG